MSGMELIGMEAHVMACTAIIVSMDICGGGHTENSFDPSMWIQVPVENLEFLLFLFPFFSFFFFFFVGSGSL